MEELKAEAAKLREENKKFRRMIENAGDMIFTINEYGVFTYISPNCITILGYPPEAFISENFSLFVHSEDVDKIAKLIAQLIEEFDQSGDAGVTHVTAEFRALTKDGQWKWMSARNTFLYKEADHYELVGIARNITEQKKAESRLRESEARYRFLVESSNDIIWTFDLSTMTYTFASDSVERILGYPKEMGADAPLDTLFAPEVKKKVLAAFGKVVNGEVDSDRVLLEAAHKHRNGGDVWLEINAMLQRDDSGHPRFFTGVSRDISDRKQAEKEKEQLEAQLRQTQKMEAIGTMAGGIAHDFNNILSSVIGYAELVLDEAAEGTIMHSNLREVLNAGHRAQKLVKQIMTFSRGVEREFSPVQMIPLLKETLAFLRSIIPSTIEFRECYTSDALTVNADPTQLHQVFVNLINNARDAIGRENGVLTVTVEPVDSGAGENIHHPEVASGHYAHISINDTGRGIAEAHRDKIFEPYFTTKEKKVGGIGLGLSVVQGIVKKHEGYIFVESEPGKGTTVHLYLPLADR